MDIFEKDIKKKLILDEEIGAGDLFFHICKIAKNKKTKIIDADKHIKIPNGKNLKQVSLEIIQYASELLATWYYEKNVKAKEAVLIHMQDKTECLLHYLALTSIGAIPILVDHNIKINFDLINEHFHELNIVGIIVDKKTELDEYLFTYCELKKWFLEQHDDICVKNVELPDWYPYSFYPNDIVMFLCVLNAEKIFEMHFLSHKNSFNEVIFNMEEENALMQNK